MDWEKIVVDLIQLHINHSPMARAKVSDQVNAGIFLLKVIHRLSIASMDTCRTLEIGDILVDLVTELVSLFEYENKVCTDVTSRRTLESYFEFCFAFASDVQHLQRSTRRVPRESDVAVQNHSERGAFPEFAAPNLCVLFGFVRT